MEKAYTIASLECAAAAWEAVMEMQNQRGARGKKIANARSRLGTAQFRFAVIGWTSAIEEDWKIADGSPEGGQYGEAFDWDFIPSWIDLNIDWADESPTMKSPRVIPGVAS